MCPHIVHFWTKLRAVSVLFLTRLNYLQAVSYAGTHAGNSLLMKTLNLFCVCEFNVSQQLVWAGRIIKINDTEHLMPEKKTCAATNPSRCLRLRLSEKTIFLFTPLALVVSFPLYLSLHLSLSFRTKCQITPFLTGVPSSHTHPVIWLLTPNTLKLTVVATIFPRLVGWNSKMYIFKYINRFKPIIQTHRD